MSTETKGTRGGESMSREQRCLPGKCIPKYEPNAGNTYCTVCLCWLHKGPPAGNSGAPEKPTRTCSQCQDYGFVKGQDERLQPCPLCKPAGDSPSAPQPDERAKMKAELLEEIKNDPANMLFGLTLTDVRRRLYEWEEMKAKAAFVSATSRPALAALKSSQEEGKL